MFGIPASTDPLRFRIALTMLLVVLCAPPLSAVDGVIEINHAKALAGGVTAGDTPGYPIIIDRPGSYVLTGNLTVSGVDDDVIDVRAENVTIDLNGFVIEGPLTCVYAAGDLTCTPEPSASAFGDGIKVREGNLAVFNGTIRGMGRMGIVNFTPEPRPFPVRVENVRLIENGWSGIDLNVTAEVSIDNCIAARNGFWGFAFGDAGRLTRSTAVQNGDWGVAVNGVSTLVRDNIIDSNVSDGIWFYGSKSANVIGNRITNNGGRGIDGGGDYAYAQNVIRGNSDGTLAGTAVEIGSNVCDTNTTCP